MNENPFELTPAQKAAATRRANAAKRKEKREQILPERRLLARTLTSILDSPEISDREKLKVSEMLLKAQELMP